MKSHKPSKVLVRSAILALVVLAMGIRHEERRPNQHVGEFWAVRSLSIWTFFGAEVFARNELAVYHMAGRTTKDLPAPINVPAVQVRRFGKIVEGGAQFNLGEDNYDQDACMDFVYWALGSSPEVAHRIVATSVFLGPQDRYPLTSKLKDALISDPDAAVRTRMQTVLAGLR